MPSKHTQALARFHPKTGGGGGRGLYRTILMHSECLPMLGYWCVQGGLPGEWDASMCGSCVACSWAQHHPHSLTPVGNNFLQTVSPMCFFLLLLRGCVRVRVLFVYLHSLYNEWQVHVWYGVMFVLHAVKGCNSSESTRLALSKLITGLVWWSVPRSKNVSTGVLVPFSGQEVSWSRANNMLTASREF